MYVILKSVIPHNDYIYFRYFKYILTTCALLGYLSLIITLTLGKNKLHTFFHYVKQLSTMCSPIFHLINLQ